MRLDIGLIGATSIAERAIIAPSARYEDVAVRAVAASDTVRAQDFAARNGITRVHRTYESLIADPRVNVVYVSVHNSAHQHWAVHAAQQGKHVIVEKPLCLGVDELARVVDAAAASNVHVIEAVPTAGHPWQAAVRDLVQRRPYGSLRDVRTHIRFRPPVDGSYRTRPELGGGIFLDCASYWLQAVQSTVGLTEATGTGECVVEGPRGADLSFRAELSWPNGVRALLECDVGERHRAEVEFVFDTASVRIRDLFRPIVAALPLNLVTRHDSGRKQVWSFGPVAYYPAQLLRIRNLLTGTGKGWGGELAAAAPRITLMAGVYHSGQRDVPTITEVR